MNKTIILLISILLYGCCGGSDTSDAPIIYEEGEAVLKANE